MLSRKPKPGKSQSVRGKEGRNMWKSRKEMELFFADYILDVFKLNPGIRDLIVVLI